MTRMGVELQTLFENKARDRKAWNGVAISHRVVSRLIVFWVTLNGEDRTLEFDLNPRGNHCLT